MTGDCHVRIREGRRVKFPPATRHGTWGSTALHRRFAAHARQPPLHCAADLPPPPRPPSRHHRPATSTASGRDLAAARVLQRRPVPVPNRPVERVHAPSRHDPAVDQPMAALLRTVADHRALDGIRPRPPGRHRKPEVAGQGREAGQDGRPNRSQRPRPWIFPHPSVDQAWCPRTHSGRPRPEIAPRAAYVLVSGLALGQEERSVKPSAQPTLVRTQHLPPPAKTAR